MKTNAAIATDTTTTEPKTRTKKLKIVSTDKRKNRKGIAVISLSPQNQDYIRGYNKDLRHSVSSLVNLCIDAARKADSLTGLAPHKPASIRRAEATLAEWNETKKKRRTKTEDSAGK